MAGINLLTVRNSYGQKVNINKDLIFAIHPEDDDPDQGYLPATIVSVQGDKVEVSRDEDYDDLIRRWTA